jgi:cysteine desulfurase
MGTTVYLDNNATTAIDPEVLDAMQPFFTEKYGNPSSIHRFGGHVKRYVEIAREQVASLIGASPEEVFFTSCGSESDNMALKGFAEVHGSKTTIITSAVEHAAILSTAKYLKGNGVSVVELGVDSEGMIDTSVFESLSITPDTLVSLMWANNETGVIFPIAKIADEVKARGGFIHTDAVQAVGKVPVDVRKDMVDILALSGHKLHAPKGIGAIYIRRGTRLAPLLHGGHQEHGVRAGTENVPYIIGLGKACELAAKHIAEENTSVRKLRDKLENALLAKCTGAKLNGKVDTRLPNTTNISFEFIEGEAILLHLDESGIAASSGSACTTGSLEPSHVLRAMGIPYTFAHSSTRFSLSRFTTEAEIDKVVEVMPGIVEKLRKISPFVSR